MAIDPGGALGWSFLSAAYLKRSKEIDSTIDAQKAEAAARRSLALRRTGNVGAALRLVQALMQQHRFSDALIAAKEAVAILPGYGPCLESESEVLFELGRYDESRKIFKDNIARMSDPPGLALEARFLVLDGKNDQALEVLNKARVQMDANLNVPRESAAWFDEKYGEALLYEGHLAEGKAALNDALTLYPRDYKAYAALTRFFAGQGDWRAVIEYGHKSNSIAQMVDIEALVGDAYVQLGNKAKAAECYQTVERVAGRPSGGSASLHDFTAAAVAHGHALDRQYAIYCADHGVNLDAAYGAALRDIQARRDIYAFDTLAWVCFKRGELHEAQLAIGKALAYGTKDPKLFFHAGMIASKSRDKAKSREYLAEALATKSALDALQSAEARAEIGA